MIKILSICCLWWFVQIPSSYAQAIRIPNATNIKCISGRTIGPTTMEVRWNAPGVKGRTGKIFGTDVAYFGTQVLGFGSNVESPWRAGADECTTMYFDSDVKINDQFLPAGKYAFFIELQESEATLIFNKNHNSWGSYFYDKSLDVLRVKTHIEKNTSQLKERMDYSFSKEDEDSAEIAMEWEHWRIPFTVSINLKELVFADIKSQMSGALGFDPASLQASAQWTVKNNFGIQYGLNWIESAISPNLGGVKSFTNLSIKSQLLEKMGQTEEAKTIMTEAIKVATINELHSYGRTLLNSGEIEEAFVIFKKNYDKNNGAWPTNAGMMRAYSAKGDYKSALKHAKLALDQAPDEVNKSNLAKMVKTLEEGNKI